jgi:hypothetical protein
MMTNDIKYCLAKFVKFVKTELDINIPFKLVISRKRTDDLTTYAYYNPSTYLIKIYGKNRGLADILRSIAHELVHHQQNQNGLLNKPHPDIGGDIEDSANSVAGQIVKKFGYANPKLLIYQKFL